MLENEGVTSIHIEQGRSHLRITGTLNGRPVILTTSVFVESEIACTSPIENGGLNHDQTHDQTVVLGELLYYARHRCVFSFLCAVANPIIQMAAKSSNQTHNKGESKCTIFF